MVGANKKNSYFCGYNSRANRNGDAGFNSFSEHEAGSKGISLNFK